MDSTGTQPAIEAIPESQSPAAIARWQRWTELGLVVLIAIAPITLATTAYLFYPTAGFAFTKFGIASGLLHEISSLLLVFYLLKRRGNSLKYLGLTFDHWTDVLKGLGLALGGVFLSAVMSVFARSISTTVTGHPAEMRDPRVIFAAIAPGWLAIYSLAAAIFEETIVRAYITTEMIALSFPVWLATVASIILQTSYHVYYGLGGAMAVSGIFIAFGIYFASSRRLLPVILGHLFVDLWATWVNHFH